MKKTAIGALVMSMAGIDLDRFKKAREDAAAKHKDKEYGDRGPGFWKPDDPAFHYVYVAPPSDDMDGFPFLGGTDGMFVHYKVGPDNKMHVCLAEDNAVLWSEHFVNALHWTNEARREKGKPEWAVELEMSDGCPTCQELTDPETKYDEKKLKEMERKQVWLHNVIPWSVMDLTGGTRRDIEPKLLRPWWASYKQWKGICDIITLTGDVTDPTAATLCVIKRTGKKFEDTRYELSADPATSRAPLVLPKPLRALATRTTAPGQANNLFMLAAGLVRSADSVRGLLRGGDTATKTTVSGGPDGPPVCYSADCDPDDSDCRRCPWKVDCAAAMGVEVPPGMDGESVDARSAAAPKATPKTAPAAAPKTAPAAAPRAAPTATAVPKPAPRPAPAAAPAEAPKPAPKAAPAPAPAPRVAAPAAPPPRPAARASTAAPARPAGGAARPAPPPPPPEDDDIPPEAEGGEEQAEEETPAEAEPEIEDDDLEAFTRDLERASKK